MLRFDALSARLPARHLRSSTHAFGRLDVYAIEGVSFSAGERLSPRSSVRWPSSQADRGQLLTPGRQYAPMVGGAGGEIVEVLPQAYEELRP